MSMVRGSMSGFDMRFGVMLLIPMFLPRGFIFKPESANRAKEFSLFRDRTFLGAIIL